MGLFYQKTKVPNRAGWRFCLDDESGIEYVGTVTYATDSGKGQFFGVSAFGKFGTWPVDHPGMKWTRDFDLDAVEPNAGGLEARKPEPQESPFRDGAMHEDFWDCYCKNNYIHRKTHVEWCAACGGLRSDEFCPDSYLAELVNENFITLEEAIEYARETGQLKDDGEVTA